MSKKIITALSCALAVMLIFAGGYYVGAQAPGTTQIEGENVIVSSEVYSLLLKYMRLNEIEKYVEMYYNGEYDLQKMYDGAAKGMTYSLGDIYADYYTAEEYEEMLVEQSGNYSGIGVRMTEDLEDGVATVITVFRDSPAMAAGILPGDRMIGVDGLDVRGVSLTEVTNMVRGETGTAVKLIIERDGEWIDLEVSRAEITANNVEYRMIGDIGYIKINSFEGDDVTGFREAVAFIENNGAKALILDLRYNGGGLVSDVVEIADILLPEGLIVYTEDKYGNRVDEKSDNRYLGLPMTVLVNKYTASSSEILAGAIQDYGIGELVGGQTFGKGIVQGYIPFKDGACLKLTIANYFTPNGRNIHGEGLTPDHTVENAAGGNPYLLTDEEDAQLQKALSLLSD